MLESNNPDINISDLQGKIDLELQKQEGAACKGDSSERLVINNPYSWGQLRKTLKIAELHVDAGSEVGSMLHFRGIVRKIARLAGKVTIYLGRVITNPQRIFNSSILHSLRIILDGIRDMNRSNALLDQRMRFVEGQLKERRALIDYLKTGLVTQERRVAILLEELRGQPVAEDNSRDDSLHNVVVPDILDSLYLSFENKFRGSREEIKERLLVYVPLIREVDAGRCDNIVLDIGCGRGEWLEILRDEGLAARGLDLNHVLVEECRKKGFEVVEQDAVSHLRSLDDNSVGAITAFHLIEHLDFEDRIALFDESVRVLRSGGVAFFETPNPRNLLVGGCNFWADPTHLRPLYPETQQFLMEYRGFCRVKLLFLHPHEGEQRLPEDEAPKLAARLNEVFSCARDYTVVGYKI